MCPCMGTFMVDLRYFTTRACADAKWLAKRIRTSGTGSPSSSTSPVLLPRGFTWGKSDDKSLACKAPRVMSPVTSGESAQTATSTVVSAKQYFACGCPSYVRRLTVGSDRFCLFRCRSLASPTGTLCSLRFGHLRSRPSSIQHPPDPGGPLSATICMISTRIISSRLILALRWCPSSGTSWL